MHFKTVFCNYLRIADEDREVTPAELRQFFIANEYKEKWEKTKSQCLAKQVDKATVKNPVTLKAAVFATDEELTFLDMQMYEDNILNLLGIAENNKKKQRLKQSHFISYKYVLNFHWMPCQ